jgi:hypothetical protein
MVDGFRPASRDSAFRGIVAAGIERLPGNRTVLGDIHPELSSRENGSGILGINPAEDGR